MTTDERIDQLLRDLDGVAQEYDNLEYGLPIWHGEDVRTKLKTIVKQFMQDMGANIVKVEAIDEFAEYLKTRGLDERHMDDMVNHFKKKQGYE